MALTKIPGELFSVGDLDISDVGIISLDAIQGDADSNTSITFSGSDVITIATGGSGRLTIGDGALSPVTDNQIDLGTSSLEFKDAFFDGTVTSDAFAGPLTGNVTGDVSGSSGSTTGNAATATALATGRTIGGTSFDGTANIAVALSATATALATARTIGGTSFDGTANIAVALADTATALASARTIHGVSFDGTANIDLSEVVADTVGAMFSSNTETGITATYEDGDNTIDLVVGTLNQDTTGLAGTATALATARTIGGTSFDGTANIVPATVTVADTTDTTSFVALFESATGDLGPKTDAAITYNAGTGALTATSFVGALTGNVTGNASGSSGSTTGNAATATALATGRTIGGVSFDGTANITPTTFATASFSGAVTAATSAKITQVALTSASNVTWDAAAQANAYLLLGHNVTIGGTISSVAYPSNATEGAIISIEIAQGGTAYTVAWDTVFEFAASTAPTMTATANKTDIYTFRYNGSVWQEIGRVQNMAQT